ncbi:hypothetical protein [Salinicola halophilus]|uniref:hypothetical protein n=1 Tax=Salinicola halophilus TaxID=184065 RepID=UPI000DA1E30B|nr:hypothetical protein [Salinicola halophilus]
MSLLQRIGDRLTGVLGRDRAGKPLRAGDRVIPAPPAGYCVPPKFQCEMTVDRISDSPGYLVCSTPDGVMGKGKPSYLRKIDDSEHDANWGRVTELTGWTPRPVEQPAEVQA